MGENLRKLILPKLYKKSSTGKIQEWQIHVKEAKNMQLRNGGIIYTNHGQMGGKIQETHDIITEGKNIGKKNETSAYEQACLNAESKWKKQRKKGYMENLEDVEAGVSGVQGFELMLAQKYSDNMEKVIFPAAMQKKLDGERIKIEVSDGKCTLRYKNGDVVNSLPHLNKALEEKFPSGDVKFDSEAYHDDYKDNFSEIQSLVNSKEPKPGHEKVQLWIFDIPNLTHDFAMRHVLLKQMIGKHPLLKVVEYITVTNHADIRETTIKWVKEGFEGAMIRNTNSLYEAGKRSYNLLKFKLFWNKKEQEWMEYMDEEFPIVGYNEGSGNLMGCVGSFVCQMPDGRKFKAKMKGKDSREFLRQCFEDHSIWEGKDLTVQFLGFTRDGIPRFPVGKALREIK